MKPSTWWPISIGAILATTVGVNIWVCVIANEDQGIAIERDYYQKAVAWDSTMAQERTNAVLGWRVVPALGAFTVRDGAGLRVTITDSTGAAIRDASVKVAAFYNARADDITDATLMPVSGGYEARLPVRHGGVWELQFDVTRGPLHFTSTSRVEAVAAAEPTPAPSGAP